MNILEILKNKPSGTPLWSPAFGNVFLDKIDEDDQYPITIKYYNRTLDEWERDGLSREGKFPDFDGSECIIFPSKQMRDWNRFFLPGDVVQRVDGNQDAPAMLLFDEWVHDDYTTFIGQRYTESGHWTIYKAHTEGYIRAAKADADWFNKLRNTTTETERPQCQFKPFDKVLVRDTSTDKWLPAFFSCVLPGRTCNTYLMINDSDYCECIPYEGNEHLIFTTDSPTDKETDL